MKLITIWNNGYLSCMHLSYIVSNNLYVELKIVFCVLFTSLPQKSILESLLE